jgi:hypothetical protein
MSKVTLDAGACGFKVVIKAKESGKRRYRIELISPCEMVKELNEEVKNREFGPEIFKSILDSEILKLSSKHIKHTSCPLPSAILKAIEVEAGLAVPRDVKIEVEK